jgi:asparagine synthase (glutamine-hydrolysing)
MRAALLTMCGIFGFTGPPDPDRLALLRDALRHRGPDGEGELVRPILSMGCDRLAIIGRADGSQPLASEDGRIQLVCNGEIYNFRALRQELERRGHRFATGSDAEVIVHAFEDDGEAALGRLQGMFALALWDEAAGRLLLARDPAGMKSLFYLRHEERWWFASEAKALLLAAGVERRLDPRGLDGLLRLGFVPGPRTLFAGVTRLPAGHCLTIESSGNTLGNTRLAPFATAPFATEKTVPARGDLTAELRRRLGAAVDSHLQAEVPVGASLSGGLDSSFLVGLMAERLGAGVKTFAIGCPGDQDERPFARRVAERFRTDHQEITVGADDLWPRLPRVVWQSEEPRGGPLVPNSMLFDRAAQDVRVLLLGEGADELFGGYLRFKTALPPLGFLPQSLAAPLYGTRKLGAARELYAPALRAARAQEDPLVTSLGPALRQYGARRLAGLLDYERRTQLPNAHLPRVDLLSMAHALEVRLPFLDSGVVALSEQVPLTAKVAWRDEKMILREAAKGLLPEDILRRRKQGQANPLQLWEAAGLLDHAADLLAGPSVRARGLFQPRVVDRLLTRLRRGRGLPFDRNRLHFLVLIEIWQRVFLDPERLAPPR